MSLENITFFINHWDDAGIFRTIDSLPEESPKIVVDGKYKEVKGSDLSPESERDKIRSIPNVILIDAPNLYEHEKRDKYLRACTTRIGFQIDSDEYVICSDWNKLYDEIKETPNGFIHIAYSSPNGDYLTYPRIIINPNIYTYYKTHFIYKNLVTGKIEKMDNVEDFLDERLITFKQDDKFRTDERMEILNTYYPILMERETPIKELYKKGMLI